jgi:hypothetical protein
MNRGITPIVWEELTFELFFNDEKIGLKKDIWSKVGAMLENWLVEFDTRQKTMTLVSNNPILRRDTNAK